MIKINNRQKIPFWINKNTIKDGGSIALYAAYTTDMAYTVDTAYTVYTVLYTAISLRKSSTKY